MDHLWDCSKLVLKTTFDISKTWWFLFEDSGYRKRRPNNLRLQNKTFDSCHIFDQIN